MKRTLTAVASLLGFISVMLAVQPLTKGLNRESMPETRKATRSIEEKKSSRLPLSLPLRPKSNGLMKSSNSLRSPLRSSASGGSIPRMLGTMINGSNWTNSYYPYGIYDLPTSAGGAFQVLKSSAQGRVAGFVLNDVYYHNAEWRYASGNIGADWYGYDITTGERVFKREFSDDNGFAVQYLSVSNSVDPTTGIIYGINFDKTGSYLQLVQITLTKDPYGYDFMQLQIVGRLEGSWNAIAFDSTGQLWGINYTGEADGSVYVVNNSYLNKIDKHTAAVTPIGSTGLCPQYASDMDFDLKTNTLYWTVCTISDDGFIATVDTATGAATKVFDFPHAEQITGLAVIGVPDAGTPDRPTGITADFPEGSLEGTVSFDIPATDSNGDAASGQVEYTVMANGVNIAQGSAEWGSHVDVQVTLPEAGEVKISVTLSANGHQGKPGLLTIFAGHGTPKAPAATAVWSDGMMTVRWSRPTETVDGGYLSPSDPFVYEIADAATGELKVRVTDATECSFALPEPADRTPFSYTVKGTCNGKSFISTTPTVYVGAIKPPYLNDFTGYNALEGYTILDLNNDGTVWTADGALASIRYNSSKAMNDWMITPGIRLEAGGHYPFSIDICCMNVAYSERIEIMAGMAPNAESMTITLLPVTTISHNNMQKYEATLCPEVSGTYYIGVHGLSFKDMHTLKVDNLFLDASPAPAAPAAVEDLTVVTDPNGELKAHISFTAPAKNSLGFPLSRLDRVDLLVNEQLVTSFPEPEPGEFITTVVNMPELAEYTFTVISADENGEGVPASVTTYIGFDTPKSSQNFHVEETEIGHVSFEWLPVTEDIHGTPLPADQILYDIYIYDAGDFIPVVKNVAETSIADTDLHIAPGIQSFYQFAVFAHWGYIMGEGHLSEMIPVGYPSEGFAESFPLFTVSSPMMIAATRGVPEWSLMIDANGFPSQDGDNGVIGLIGEYSTDTGVLYTGKFTVDHLVNPVMRFWAYNIYNAENPLPNDDNTIVVRISEDGGKTYSEVRSTTFFELGGTKEGWYPVIIDLTPYIGKTICFSVESTLSSYCYSVFDNFRTYSYVEQNLSLRDISAPQRVAAGGTYNVAVTLVNEGYEEATGHSVDLYVDGNLFLSKEAPALAPDGRQVIEIPMTMNTLATEPIELKAVAVLAADNLTDNNTSETIMVTPIISNLPEVTGLWGTMDGNRVSLTWNEPDYRGGIPATVMEDFESYDPWNAQAGDWTSIDLDQSEVSGFLGVDIPNIRPGISKASFFVFNADEMPEEEVLQFEAHSGTQYMAALQRYDNGELDDWLISPELSGHQQVISFWGKSYSRIFTDSFEVYYSTGSTNPSDFIKVDGPTTMPSEWCLYTAELPAGAKRFAIRACSVNSFMFMLDDVSYESGTETTAIELKGYNLWRDGEKVNTRLLSSREYTEEIGSPREHTYVVTAVYDLGESKASNSYRPGQSGVETIASGSRVIAIYTSDGLTLPAGTELQPGVYFFHYSDGRTVKTIVK